MAIDERPRKEVTTDEKLSSALGHKFSPRGEWYTVCRHCGLAEAAHTSSELHYIGDDFPDE